ncbi:DUF262 domain-containing protein [Capnocytophaga stomatis]|uniref:DUF262 domain-containing protein n=1 Tax=Capnocytophaga stomatis TaxID=1848904 RepID=UPI00385D53E7
MMNQIQAFNIKELFNSGFYRIPIYQRNYAWGKKEIAQLIQDILDYIPEQRNYYIGTLVVYPRKVGDKLVYDTIDGQQRLTTISIMLSVLKNKFEQVDWFSGQILEFESRPLSQNAMVFVNTGYFDGHKEYHSTIKEAYENIELELLIKLKDSYISKEEFAKYLSDFVTILRVEVPYDTDLNHYFEIMNNRGEQLEKHEVVKSILMDYLYDEEDESNISIQELFHVIWDAVQDMERYVQFGFAPDLRKELFGKDWSNFQIKNTEALLETFRKYKSQNVSVENIKVSISEILKNEKAYYKDKTSQKEVSERFTSPINFQNFLLHILKIQTASKEISLDDKKLIDHFNLLLKTKTKPEAKSFISDFMFNLLRGKWLLDSYIIKRQFLTNKEGWSLQKLTSNDGTKGYYINTFGEEKNSDNEYIIMLLSMFHVSTPTMIYKYWLNAALFYLMNKDIIIQQEYRSYLERFAKQLICFRFLNADASNRLDYNDLIYNSENLSLEYPRIAYDNSRLNYKSIENNLVFNFLDYIIWEKRDTIGVNIDFEFTFRSSVEHYYPQNPIGGKPLENEDLLHSFGNLCLISHQKNSKLNHHLPSAKKNYYTKLNGKNGLVYDSLKQYVMMTTYDADNWDECSIQDHHKKMIDILNDFIQN